MKHNSLFEHQAFLGPKAENKELLIRLINKVIDTHTEWRRNAFPEDEGLFSPVNFSGSKLEDELDKFLERSKQNLPYFHPRYMAQMLKDPSLPTVLGMLTFALSNPNNHAYEGGPVTTEMEMEVTEMLMKMCGYRTGWGHLASGGSLANMEALWAARDYYGDGAVLFSEVSHYSWKRICSILRMPDYAEIKVDRNFRIDLNSLEDELKKRKVMFVMANCGSTGTGSVDDIESIVALKEKYGFHLHIDAAYGGFFRTLLIDENGKQFNSSEETVLSDHTFRQLKAIEYSDSITIDPHKQGLISYGAGAVLYKDENLRRGISNTAPYTYHKTDKPNIGMFSLEGSRPGAMAAACYLTYKVLPLNNTGVGAIIENCILASKKLYELIDRSNKYKNLTYPDLDINCFYRTDKGSSINEINSATLGTYNQLSVEAENPEFILSKFVLPSVIAHRLFPEYANPENQNLNSLRAVLMKHWYTMNNFYYLNKLAGVLENIDISVKT